MTNFKLEDDVPMPEDASNSKYPFTTMNVGQSFFAEGTTPTRLNNATSAARKKGRKFLMRQTEEANAEGKMVKGTRTWRKE
jgi:hypothetical protein